MKEFMLMEQRKDMVYVVRRSRGEDTVSGVLSFVGREYRKVMRSLLAVKMGSLGVGLLVFLNFILRGHLSGMDGKVTT